MTDKAGCQMNTAKSKNLKPGNPKKITCGITMGDPSGIGPEIILKSLTHPGILRLANYIVIGDSKVFAKFPAASLGHKKISIVDMENVAKAGFTFGIIKAEYARASMEYLKMALELVKSGIIDCLVTAPISKEAINLAGFRFPGHTEYIARFFSLNNVEMMLLNEKIKVVLATRHIRLSEVSRNLTVKKLYQTIKTAAISLKLLFAIKRPRLAVCGLNPHASDNGLLGNEEQRVIIPAIKKASRLGIIVSGPYASDTVFPKAAAGKYDAVISMYHDQAMIPLKMSGLDKSVNITLGLPFVRTSPGHGTAFDIAGKAKADPGPFIQAIKTAIKCTQNQRKG